MPIKWIPIFSGVLGSVAFGPFIGGTISKLSERTSFSNKSVHQIISFISKPLTMTFWNHLFTNLFGTFGNPKGVLLDFINKYHELPSTLHLDNFDFYLPLASLIVGEHQLDFHNASLKLSLHTTAIREGVHLLALKDAFESLDQKWFGTKEFPLSLDMDISDYADGDRDLVENMLSNELSWFFPILRYELHDYFSLSHTKLKYHESTEATLYFNCPEEGVSFQRTIWIEGHRDCNT